MVVNLHCFILTQYSRPRAVEFLTMKLMVVNTQQLVLVHHSKKVLHSHEHRVFAVLSLRAKIMVVNLHYFILSQYSRLRAVKFLMIKLMAVNPHQLVLIHHSKKVLYSHEYRVFALPSLGAKIIVVNLHCFVPTHYSWPRAEEFLTTKLMTVNPHQSVLVHPSKKILYILYFLKVCQEFCL